MSTTDSFSSEKLATMNQILQAQGVDLGVRAFEAPQFASVRDGFPPKTDNIAVLDPETHRIEVLKGNVPDAERIHHVALDVLVQKFGPQQTPTAEMRGEFSNSAAAPQNDTNLAALFNNTPTGGYTG